MRRTTFSGVVMLLGAALAATGCTASAPASSPPASSSPHTSRPVGHGTADPAVAAAERRVRCGPDRQQASVPLPPGFVAAAAVLCPLVARLAHEPGHVRYPKQVASHGLAPLMAALRLRPPPPTPGTVCAVQAVPVTWLLLINRAGRVIRPEIPDGACGQPPPQFLHALQHLPWVTVSGAG
jgi:hypothetical protein